MNGAIVLGVALILVGVFIGGPLLPMLIGGVAFIAFGAFAPIKPQRDPRLPRGDDPFI
jgi:hypothetical protein